MENAIKYKILEAVSDLKKMGGNLDPDVNKVIKKLKKVIKDKEKSKK